MKRFIRHKKIAKHMIPINSLLARDVLELLIDRAIGDRSNELVIEKAQRYAMARRIAILKTTDEKVPHTTPTDRNIQKALTRLVSHNVLKRYGKGKYRLNPDMFFYGTSDAEERYAEIYAENKAA